MSTPRPDSVELCAKVRDNHPCLGRIHRPFPDRPKCWACGGSEAGVVYVRGDERTVTP